MKKFLFALITLLPLLSQAQVEDDEKTTEPFIGVQGSTTRYGVSLGVLCERVELTLSGDRPMGKDNARSKITSVTAGYVVVNNNFYVTLFAGYASLSSRIDDSKETRVIIPKRDNFIGGTEIGYSRSHGKVFVTGRYCERFFVTAGFKVFPFD